MKNKNLSSFEEQDSDRGDFEDFYNENLAPIFGMMAVVDTADFIGVNSATLSDLLKKCPNIISDEKADKIDCLISKINSMVEDEEFKNKVKSKILFVKEHGIIDIDGNKIIGSFEGENDKYRLEIVIEERKIKFNSSNINLVQSGEFGRTESGRIYIKYSDVKTTIFENVDKDGKEDNEYDSYDIKTESKTQVFDENGIQTWEYNQENNENYFLNKKTGTKILANPDCDQNYCEKEYKMRAPKNYIIKRVIRKYVYPETAESFIPLMNYDTYLIGINICPDERRLPFGGNFVWFDIELFQKYKNGECDIKDIWKNKGDTYKKKLNG